MAKASECSSCGAEIQIKNAASLYAVCPYCGTTSLREADKLKAIGKAAELLEDGSPLQLGTTGHYRGERFEIIGRIQLHFPSGFWNEWHIDYAGNSAWLGEATGRYVFTRLLKDYRAELPAFSELKVGKRVDIGNTSYYVCDILQGKCVSAEGELPFAFNQGYDAPVVDLASPDEDFATIDYSEETPLVFTGQFALFQDLKFANLRYLEGWPKPRAHG